ncbi:MAG: FAD-dependent monooxygenase [Ferruginibacter sp.]
MNKPKTAIIIGGGIAGPATALFLKKAGILSHVFEASSHSEDLKGGGLNIAPNGFGILNNLGLKKEIITQGNIVKNAIFKNANGSKLASFKYTNIEKYGEPTVNIKRSDLYKIFKTELANQEIPFDFSKKLIQIVQNAECVEAFFEDGTSYKADILIGADGVRSKTREYVLQQQIEPSFTGIVGSGGFVSVNKLTGLTFNDREDLNFIYGKNGFFGFSGANSAELMWWTNIKTEHPFSKTELRDFNWEIERSNLLKQFSAYSLPVQEIIRNSDTFVRVNVFDVANLPTWNKERIIVLGDAAHAVSPNSGQGASLALEDAMLLSKLLRDEPHFKNAFQKFEKERKPRVEKVVSEGKKRGNDKILVNSFQQFVRELIIRIFVNLFAEKGNEWLFDYKIDWEKDDFLM